MTVGQTQPVFGRIAHKFDDEAHRSVGDQEARVKEAAAVVRAGLQKQQPGQDAEVADGLEQLGRPVEMAGAEGAYCPPAAAVEEAADADRAEHAEDVDRGIIQGVNAPHPEREPDQRHQKRHQQRGAEEREAAERNTLAHDLVNVFDNEQEFAAEYAADQHRGGEQHSFERPHAVFFAALRKQHEHHHHHIAQGHEGVVGRYGELADMYVRKHGIRVLSE